MEEFDQREDTTGSTLNWAKLLCPQEKSFVPEIIASNLTTSWTKDDSKLVLKDISFQVTQVGIKIVL